MTYLRSSLLVLAVVAGGALATLAGCDDTVTEPETPVLGARPAVECGLCASGNPGHPGAHLPPR